MSKKAKTGKISLSDEQIENLLDFIKPNKYIPKDIADDLCEKHKNMFRVQLKNVKIYPQLLDKLKENMREMYQTTIIQPGESVGIITAQSIGERQTQTNLNTFHKAGSADKQPTVSKFAELLNATPKPKSPSYFIYLKHLNDTVGNVRKSISYNLLEITLQKVCKNYNVKIEKERDEWYDIYELLYGKIDRSMKNCIVVQVNLDILFEYGLTLYKLAEKLNSEYSDIFCIHSPDCYGEIHIFANTDTIELPENVYYINEENKIEIYLEEVVYENLSKSILFGIQGVKNIFFLQDMESKKWFIETENTCDKNIKRKKRKGSKKPPDSTFKFKTVLSKDFVDATKTVSNNIWDIYHCFGIEAVRQYMIDEFSNIMKGINTCHVALLVDKMTFEGTISSVSRYSMRSDECGPLNKATFEETLDNFLKAGIFSQEETTKGVSASIICGKKPKIGTGYCNISIDMEKMEDKIE